MLNRVTNKLVCGTGFEIYVPDIHRVLYKEGEHSAVIEIEGGTDGDGRVNWLVYEESLRGWEPPNESEVMSADKRVEILSRVGEAFKLLDMPFRCVR